MLLIKQTEMHSNKGRIFNMGYKIICGDTLSHHGILGMKWGEKNGPPYPIAPKNHSVSEKRAGWKKSLNKTANKVTNSVKEKYSNAYNAGKNTDTTSVVTRVAMNTVKNSIITLGANTAATFMLVPATVVFGPAGGAAVAYGTAAFNGINTARYIIDDAGVIVGHLDKKRNK